MPFVELKTVDYVPCTIAYAIRKLEQIDSFSELPKSKVPPKSIWHNEYKLNWWFKEVFEEKHQYGDSEIHISMAEVE